MFRIKRCARCGGRGYQFASRPDRPCKYCQGNGYVATLDPDDVHHLIKALTPHCVATKECKTCIRIRRVLLDHERKVSRNKGAEVL